MPLRTMRRRAERKVRGGLSGLRTAATDTDRPGAPPTAIDERTETVLVTRRAEETSFGVSINEYGEVVSLVPGGAAARGGLELMSLVKGIDGKAVRSRTELLRALQAVPRSQEDVAFAMLPRHVLESTPAHTDFWPAVAEPEPEPQLPDGWEVAVSRSTGEEYYYNASTGESSYEWPAGAQRAEPASSPAPAVASTDGGRKLPDGWEVAVSRSTGGEYYYNASTGESSYEWPAGAQHAEPASSPAPAVASTDGGRKLPDGWEVAVSRSTGEEYYYNASTGESSYEWPAGAQRVEPASAPAAAPPPPSAAPAVEPAHQVAQPATKPEANAAAEPELAPTLLPEELSQLPSRPDQESGPRPVDCAEVSGTPQQSTPSSSSSSVAATTLEFGQRSTSHSTVAEVQRRAARLARHHLHDQMLQFRLAQPNASLQDWRATATGVARSWCTPVFLFVLSPRPYLTWWGRAWVACTRLL
jgi:hypothetical protein